MNVEEESNPRDADEGNGAGVGDSIRLFPVSVVVAREEVAAPKDKDDHAEGGYPKTVGQYVGPRGWRRRI